MPSLTNVALSRNSDGHLEVLAASTVAGSEPTLWHAQEDPDGQWSGWHPFGNPGHSRPTTVSVMPHVTDGRLEAFTATERDPSRPRAWWPMTAASWAWPARSSRPATPWPATPPTAPTSPSPSNGTRRGRAPRPLPAGRWRPAPCPPRASAPACRAHGPSAAAAQPWHGPGSGPAASLAGPAHRRQPAVPGAVPGSAYRPRGRGGSLRANDARVTPPVRRDPGRRPGLSPGGTLTGPAGTIAPEGHDRACHAGGPGRPLPKGGGSPRRDTQRYEARRAEEKGKPMPSAGHKEGPKNSSPVTGPDRPGRPTGR